MKIRQRFRDTDEIRSRRRVIPAALPCHGEEDPPRCRLGPWHLHELEGEAEEKEDGGATATERRGGGGAAAAVARRGLGAGLRALVELVSPCVHPCPHIYRWNPNPFESY